ncbi:unnamed protein product [Effrenium voratum]|nr:unnamed protein product [Effrenium voratum]
MVRDLDIATQEALKQAQGLAAASRLAPTGRRGAKEVDGGSAAGDGSPEVFLRARDDKERLNQALQRVKQLQGTVDLLSAAYGDAFGEFQRLREEYESRLEECQFFELQCSRRRARDAQNSSTPQLGALRAQVTTPFGRPERVVLSQTPGASETQQKFPVHFSDYPGKPDYFDVYSPPIKTLYSQVFWSGLPPVDLPSEVVQRFEGKGMAVVGFEVDQVRRTDQGDVAVPITVAYNHHFETTMIGKRSRFVQEELPGPNFGQRHEGHGAPLAWQPGQRRAWRVKEVSPSDLSMGTADAKHAKDIARHGEELHAKEEAGGIFCDEETCKTKGTNCGCNWRGACKCEYYFR